MVGKQRTILPEAHAIDEIPRASGSAQLSYWQALVEWSQRSHCLKSRSGAL